MIAKCANPVCRVRFDHHIEGKFFRFHLTEVEVPEIPGATQNAHHVIHYWLCPLRQDFLPYSRGERQSGPPPHRAGI